MYNPFITMVSMLSSLSKRLSDGRPCSKTVPEFQKLVNAINRISKFNPKIKNIMDFYVSNIQAYVDAMQKFKHDYDSRWTGSDSDWAAHKKLVDLGRGIASKIGSRPLPREYFELRAEFEKAEKEKANVSKLKQKTGYSDDDWLD